MVVVILTAIFSLAKTGYLQGIKTKMEDCISWIFLGILFFIFH